MDQKIKIIIADDDPNIRESLKDILVEKKYLVETVKNGYELLASLKKSLSHIIILDLIMPEKDGIEIISAVKSLSPHSKVIIYTGFKRYERSIYARSVDKFLLKAGSPEILLQTISELAVSVASSNSKNSSCQK